MKVNVPHRRWSSQATPPAGWRQCHGELLRKAHTVARGQPPLPHASFPTSSTRRLVSTAAAPESRGRAAATTDTAPDPSRGVDSAGSNGVSLGALRNPAAAAPMSSGEGGSSPAFSSAGTMGNSSITSMDWNDWMMSSSSSSSDGEGMTVSDVDGGDAVGGPGGSSPERGGAGGLAPVAAAAGALPVAGGASATIRIAFYAVAASFDRRQLEGRLREVYGNQAVRKYPDVIHCQLCRGREAQPGTDMFFLDYGVVACWGMSPDAERELVQNLAVQCAVQPLPDRDQERDVFRCTFATNPLELEQAGNAAAAKPAAAAATAAPVAPPVVAAAAAVDPLGSLLDVEYGVGGGSGGSMSGTTSSRRYTRRAERIAPLAAPAAAPVVPVAPVPAPQPPRVETAAEVAPPTPAAIGPFSFLTFPPKISDDTVLLHVRHIGDTATLLAVSYALAQSTKLSAFEKAVEALVEDTQGLPEALAEHGQVHLSDKEIGKLLGKVFVLKRSVNLLSRVADTPEFFWYAPDQLQSLYSRITQYVELSERVEQLNGRFDVLQELLELLRAQEENRHGNRLELVVIWLIVTEVVLGVFELLELFGVIGPKHGF